MTVLEFLEHLALNPACQSVDVDAMLARQDATVQRAFRSHNSELLRHHLSQNKPLADKTTVFQV